MLYIDRNLEQTKAMTTKISVKQDSRSALLELGMDIMLEKGYTNTGIQEILTALSIPKGSFYHYFDSKESYAIEVIRHYDQKHTANLLRILRNPKQTPLARLKLSAKLVKLICLLRNVEMDVSLVI